jgi:hypothetical protein
MNKLSPALQSWIALALAILAAAFLAAMAVLTAPAPNF